MKYSQKQIDRLIKVIDAKVHCKGEDCDNCIVAPNRKATGTEWESCRETALRIYKEYML